MPATAATLHDDRDEAARSGPAAPAWGAVFAIAVTVAWALPAKAAAAFDLPTQTQETKASP